MNSTCLLITATISPNGPAVNQVDPVKRLAEYEQALAFYARLPYDIIFIENSGFDFSTSQVFEELRKTQRVHFHAVPGSSDPSKGKGFQEFEMLDWAVEHLCHRYHSFVKITGRYIVRNAESLIAEGVHDIRIDRHRRMKVAITGFFHCSVDFYNIYLRNLYLLVNDPSGLYIEHVLYRQLAALQSKKRIEMFRRNPDYRGVSGSHGNSMQRHPVKMSIRNVERRLLKLVGQQEFFVEY